MTTFATNFSKNGALASLVSNSNLATATNYADFVEHVKKSFISRAKKMELHNISLTDI